jgi:hypothetical protein
MNICLFFLLLNIIELFSEERQPEEIRKTVPIFDSKEQKFRFILNYLSSMSNNLFLSISFF